MFSWPESTCRRYWNNKTECKCLHQRTQKCWIDFGSTSGTGKTKYALDLAGKHAKAFGAGLIVITSLEGGTETDAGQVQQAEEDLAHAETLMKDNGVAVETHLLVRGLNPGEDIVKYAEENKVDAIFIGVRRRSKVGKLLSGSNAQYIILKAPCPVMTIK